MSKNRKQRQADQLGMPVGTAQRKLHRKIIWGLLVRSGDNTCAHCGDWVRGPEDLAITHVEPWLDNPELFWDTRNVAFMHPKCAEDHAHEREAARRQEENMQLVQVGIVNDRGEWLPGCAHQGKIYVAGRTGERYKITLKNLTSSRVEVVLSVDGRDVIKGDVASRDARGYIIPAHGESEIEGWRVNNDEVAAFRFGADKHNAYSAQLGTGAHLGVIGVAVFEEREVRYTSRGSGYLGGTSYSTGYGEYSWAPGGETNATWTSDSDPVPVGASGPGASGHPAGMVLRSMNTNDRSRETSFKRSRVRKDVKLGTKFGETLTSRVGTTTFLRKSHTPSQENVIEYDSYENLKARGVPIQRTGRTPSAFPADSEFCKPPPRR